MSLSLLRARIATIGGGLLGLATNTWREGCQLCRRMSRAAAAGRTHLEDVEGFELDVAALVAQEVHHHLEVRLARDVARHDLVVCPVEDNFAEQLDRLALGDVVGREDERRVRRKELRTERRGPEASARTL
jgi:hypothetical protein